MVDPELMRNIARTRGSPFFSYDSTVVELTIYQNKPKDSREVYKRRLVPIFLSTFKVSHGTELLEFLLYAI